MNTEEKEGIRKNRIKVIAYSLLMLTGLIAVLTIISSYVQNYYLKIPGVGASVALFIFALSKLARKYKVE